MRSKTILLSLFLFFGCTPELEFRTSQPVVRTQEVVNITETGVELTAVIENLGTGDQITDYGFVWGTKNLPTTSIGNKESMTEPAVKGPFTKVIAYDMVKGQEYNVRSFIQTDKMTVYGEQVSFKSIASSVPEITDFTPKEGFDGAEVTLHGKNFPTTLAKTVVMLGQNCTIVSSTENEIKIIVPTSDKVGEFPITLKVGTLSKIAGSPFKILGPTITSLSSMSGFVGDKITVHGPYLTNQSSSIYFGGYFSFSYGPTTGQFDTYVPDAPVGDQPVTMNSPFQNAIKTSTFPEKFKILNAWSQTVTNTPYHGAYNRAVSAVIGNSIYFLAGKTFYEFNTTNRVFTQKTNFPGGFRYYGSAFAANGKFYYGFGTGYNEVTGSTNGTFYNDLWVYDPVNNGWTSLGDSPVAKQGNVKSGVINGKAYVVGADDFWEYNISNNTWTSISIPIQPTKLSAAFIINNRFYVIKPIDFSQSLWEYNPAGNSWLQRESLDDQASGEMGGSINDQGLIVFGSNSGNWDRVRIHQYDAATDRWFYRQRLSLNTVQGFQVAGNTLYVLHNGNLMEMTF